ncbi:efflux RND transporter permease subunit [Bradyrhizobium sp. ARR65]|uniref:efflux RND transporter permease subunit n=1 Tax=Bradyrhizobium sp. ARR65 TaxID=1040989 RepID=UPI000464AE18|nr:efflux RND transporter permease subunit [Bradyrhizobium sp. ARR65]
MTDALISAAKADPRLVRVCNLFTATSRSVYLDIDRRKRPAIGLTISRIFGALQATLGCVHGKKFNLDCRTWRVNVRGNAFDPSAFANERIRELVKARFKAAGRPDPCVDDPKSKR